MIQTLTIHYQGETINLKNQTIKCECLVFENSEWKIEIVNRDAISCLIKIKNWENRKKTNGELISKTTFFYYCLCDIRSAKINPIIVFNLTAKKKVGHKVLLKFIEPAIEDIYQQLKKELVCPFIDDDYREWFISKLKKAMPYKESDVEKGSEIPLLC